MRTERRFIVQYRLAEFPLKKWNQAFEYSQYKKAAVAMAELSQYNREKFPELVYDYRIKSVYVEVA